MLVISLFLSGLLLAFVCNKAIGETPGAYTSAACVSASGLIFAFCGSIALFLNASMLIILCIYAARTQMRFRKFLATSLGITLLAYLIVGLPQLITVAELRTKYPFESIAKRLEYENTKTAAQLVAKPSIHTNAKRLNEQEEKLGLAFSWRPRSLKQLHENAFQSFVNSPGFGVLRMSIRYEYHVDLAPIKSVPLPPPGPEDLSASADLGKPLNPMKVSGRPSEDSLTELHESGLFDFVKPERFGYVKDRDHVAGFQAHHVQEIPEIDSESPRRWNIRSLQLISLLKHKKPVAYVSQDLPRMDQLRHAKTRPLDSFESDGLKTLRRGEDLHIAHYPKFIRMLGSVRALKQCLDCHQVQRGRLLGAFTYKLVRE